MTRCQDGSFRLLAGEKAANKKVRAVQGSGRDEKAVNWLRCFKFPVTTKGTDVFVFQTSAAHIAADTPMGIRQICISDAFVHYWIFNSKQSLFP